MVSKTITLQHSISQFGQQNLADLRVLHQSTSATPRPDGCPRLMLRRGLVLLRRLMLPRSLMVARSLMLLRGLLLLRAPMLRRSLLAARGLILLRGLVLLRALVLRRSLRVVHVNGLFWDMDRWTITSSDVRS